MSNSKANNKKHDLGESILRETFGLSDQDLIDLENGTFTPTLCPRDPKIGQNDYFRIHEPDQIFKTIDKKHWENVNHYEDFCHFRHFKTAKKYYLAASEISMEQLLAITLLDDQSEAAESREIVSLIKNNFTLLEKLAERNHMRIVYISEQAEKDMASYLTLIRTIIKDKTINPTMIDSLRKTIRSIQEYLPLPIQDKSSSS